MAGPFKYLINVGCSPFHLPLPCTVVDLGPVCIVPTCEVLNKHLPQPQPGPEVQSAVTLRPRGSVWRAQGFPQQVRDPASGQCSCNIPRRNAGQKWRSWRGPRHVGSRWQRWIDSSVRADELWELPLCLAPEHMPCGLWWLLTSHGNGPQLKPSHPLLEPNVCKAMREIKFVFIYPPHLACVSFGEQEGLEGKVGKMECFYLPTMSTYCDAFSRIPFRDLKISVM